MTAHDPIKWLVAFFPLPPPRFSRPSVRPSPILPFVLGSYYSPIKLFQTLKSVYQAFKLSSRSIRALAATRSSKTSNLGPGNHHQAFCDPAEEPSSNLLPSVSFKPLRLHTPKFCQFKVVRCERGSTTGSGAGGRTGRL